MQCVLLAELAILVEFDSVWIILLVLVGLVVATLALSAGQRNCIAHFMHSLLNINILTKHCSRNVTSIIYHKRATMSI